MSKSFKWVDGRLCGPVSEIDAAGEPGRAMPVGPLASAPFNSGRWIIGITKDEGKWSLWFEWNDQTDRGADLFITCAITDRTDGSPLRCLTGRVEIGDILINPEWIDTSVVYSSVTQLNKLLAAGSEFSLTVACPSLRDQDQANKLKAQTVNSHLFGTDLSLRSRRRQPKFDLTNSTPMLVAGMMSSPQPFDVRFIFPGAEQAPLWFSSTILKQEIPYFAKLFDNLDQPSNQSSARTGSSVASDSLPSPLAVQIEARLETQPAPNLVFRTCRVTSPDRDTFAALLLWHLTNHITFAPLGPKTPACAPVKGARSGKRAPKRQRIAPAGALEQPSSAPAAAWEGAFLAAALLESAPLRGLALAAFRKALAIGNVVQALFGPLSVAHAEVRDVALGFAVEHRQEVRKQPEMRAKIEAFAKSNQQSPQDKIVGAFLAKCALAE